MKKWVLCLLVLVMGSVGASFGQDASDGKGESGQWTTTFDGYAGPAVLVAPMDGALELIVATHLRAWVACNPEAYLPTVGGYIHERLGGSITADEMRNGLETRYPGNPIVRVTVIATRRIAPDSAEVDYRTQHKDGFEVTRTLIVRADAGGWRIHRVRRAR